MLFPLNDIHANVYIYKFRKFAFCKNSLKFVDVLEKKKTFPKNWCLLNFKILKFYT